MRMHSICFGNTITSIARWPFWKRAKSTNQDFKAGLRGFVVGLHDSGLGSAVLGLGFVAGANVQKARM